MMLVLLVLGMMAMVLLVVAAAVTMVRVRVRVGLTRHGGVVPPLRSSSTLVRRCTSQRGGGTSFSTSI